MDLAKLHKRICSWAGEDVAQETITRLLEAQARGETINNLTGWCYAQARWRRADERRHQKRLSSLDSGHVWGAGQAILRKLVYDAPQPTRVELAEEWERLTPAQQDNLLNMSLDSTRAERVAQWRKRRRNGPGRAWSRHGGSVSKRGLLYGRPGSAMDSSTPRYARS